MMVFHIFTIFPEVLESYFGVSVLKRAQKENLIRIKIHNIRDFSKNKHKTVDDRPFGGGAGMVMKAEPIIRAVQLALKRIKNNELRIKKTKIILLSASGKQFTQATARNLAKNCNDILLICGRYEGIDERLKSIIRNLGFMVQELSIGPYILTGGELPAMTIADAVARHIPGVLGSKDSLEEIKGSYSVYTRPEVIKYKDKKYRVPRVLLSGDHKKIKEWRKII
ncbi:tRNA (guanosine(37)-N1)-methyltransferase TrmD [Patescibacteria group bacterium]|nr:tRNA (guanosine(37)-N1)-methyltransferase TrmD [Patescibacteria group bacterium]MBU2633204.1 tRNA (guanosine(37)-N1)-methyltransferase TrmD [Patescibacteria group bacterium]